MYALPRMLRSRGRLIRALSGTISASLISQITLVVTGVIIARALGPEDRGHFAFLTLVAAIFWTIGPLGIPIALSYSVARVPQRAADIIIRLRTPIVIHLVVATLCTATLLLVLTGGRPDYVQVAALVVIITVPGVIAQQFGLNALLGLRRFAPFNVYRVAPNAVFALVAPGLLLAGNAGFIEIALGWAISTTVFTPLVLRNAWRHARAAQTGGGEAPSTSWMLRFGRRGLFGEQPMLEGFRVDQAVIAFFLPPIALGLYVVALAFTNLPRFIAQAIAQFAVPMVAGRSNRDEARRTMWRYFWFAIPIYLPVVAAIWLVVPELTVFFFGDEFAAAAPITRLLLIWTALYCARRVLIDTARAAGYPGLGAIAELLALVSALPLLATFVPLWETNGVAYALIGSAAVGLGVVVVGLLRPTARYAQAGAGWFETQPSAELPGGPDPGDTPYREPTSGSV